MGSATEKANLLVQEDKPAGKLHLSWLSSWTLWWITSTIRKSYRRPLQALDIYDILPEFSTEENVRRLLRRCDRSNGEDPNGAKIFLQCLCAYPVSSGCLQFLFLVSEGFRLSQPILLGMLLKYMSDDTESAGLGYTYAALMILSALMYSYLNNRIYYMCDLLEMWIRAAYSSLIYSKILKLWVSQCQRVTRGNIINLFSTDVELLIDSVGHGFCMVKSPLTIVVVIALLYIDFGWCLFVGLAVFCVFLIASLICSRKYASMRTSIAKAADTRVELMNEIICAIRVIKMYCWEEPFQDVITKARKEEVRRFMVSRILKGLASGIRESCGCVVTATVFVTYYATGHELTASIVFKALLLFGMLKTEGMGAIPRAVQRLGQVFRSLERIEKFIRMEEKDETEIPREPNNEPKTAIAVAGAWVSWDDCGVNTEKSYQLKNLTFSCERGVLLAVVGSVGAGKTSLLMHLANEMPVKTGQTIVSGQISYSPQNPWICQDTLQQNILFGSSMNTTRYQEVLDVCNLLQVGIVGRTGSGKSSMLQCLLRLTEPCGRLFIDGIDVTKIGLRDLRDKISVIPQDAVLFSGTIRHNLDPLLCTTDENLWGALVKVQLADKVRNMSGGLDGTIYEGGSNLSVGERQLVCLARAVLKRNKILVLDEATANVDQETDTLIQLTIKEHFSQCTVLTIAHRLHTIMESDKVMVLDEGRMIEYDSPYLLLQNTGGLFYKYVQHTGPESAESLLETAKAAYLKKSTITP